MADFKEWEGFEGRLWKEGVNHRLRKLAAIAENLI